MRLDVVIGREAGADRLHQCRLRGLWIFKAKVCEFRLLEQHFPANDFVNPRFIDFQFAQRVRQFDHVSSSEVIRRRTLEHSDMTAPVANGGDERGSCCTGSDHD